jgi:hypothetical protein
VSCCTPTHGPRGRGIAALGVEFIESLRAGDTLAAGQILSDVHADGGRRAVGVVLASACEWGIRTAPRQSPRPPHSVPADSTTSARNRCLAPARYTAEHSPKEKPA